MDFTTLTIDALKALAAVAGNYGIAIILLTVAVRLAMWPLNVSQQRSMRQMQALQPKLKAIQTRYKSDPQKMQTKMMEFYKEHNFNPMGGCMPLLIQMPIFILLYSALMSPQFIQIAGDTSFLGIKRLDTTLRASAGISNDGVMGVSKNDIFNAGKTARVYISGEVVENVKINKPAKALEIQGEIKPGEPIDFKISLDHLDLKFSQLDKIEKADISVTDVNTRETEKASFERQDGLLTASVPTVEVKQAFHWDILVLIAIFGLTMWLSQKFMMSVNKNNSKDPAQEAIQKSMGTFMPLMIIATFVIIPIPAGVLLYLVTSNILQIAQTVIVNKQMDLEDAKKQAKIDDEDLNNAKKIEPKE
ncbi:MAG: YidC/Oxa1 family membrane protein insertase [Heliobacteriaceae bacterium]|nr:YidC/Oxa1 family membrane protein insertase [Heliobacteriaceae bacterium]